MSFACDNIHGHTLYLEKESIKGKECIYIMELAGLLGACNPMSQGRMNSRTGRAYSLLT